MAGMAGMGEAEFWQTSLRYLFNRLEGYRKAKEIETQVTYEVARWQAMQMLLPHLQKGKTLKVTDLGKFYWELSEKEKAALEKEAEKTDPTKLAAMQEKVHKAIEEGRIKWEPVTNVNDLK